MKSLQSFGTTRAVVLGALFAGSVPALAETESPPSARADHAGTLSMSGVVEEIVVSARKRSESAQSVPVSITALDATAISRLNIKNLGDINVSPNVEISTTSVQPTGAVMFIRGVGNRAQEPFVDAPVAVSVDGVYLASSSGALIDMFDVQQIEVLRGPQGTLQGRNSPGGAINITTRRPSGETGIEAEIGYARFNSSDIKLAAETPIIDDKLALRASFLSSHSDGQVRNITTGRSTAGHGINAARLSLLYTPTDALSIFVSGDHVEHRSDQTGLRAANSTTSAPRQPIPFACTLLQDCSPDRPYTTRSDFDAPYEADISGVSATADLELGGATITSVSGYREFDEDQNVDTDGLPTQVLHVFDRTFHLQTVSQELRIASTPGGWSFGDRFDWVAGTIYYRSRYDLNQPVRVFQDEVLQTGRQHLESYAIFGQGTLHLSDRWTISSGGRQTWDRKRYSGVQSGFPPSSRVSLGDRWSDFSFEVGTEFQLNDGQLLYARFSQGYRSGGVNGGAGNPADVNFFNPEYVDAYEIGAKTDWLDKRLRVNLALFYNDYTDLQRDILKTSATGQGFAQIVENAASARIPGAELEILAKPIEALSARLSVGYLDAKYSDFVADLIGNGIATDNSDLRLPFTPKLSISAGADYAFDSTGGARITFSAALNMKSEHSVNPLDIPVGFQNDYVTGDASIRYDAADGRIGLDLYIQNLSDERYIVAGENVSNLVHWQVDGARRTYGARLFLSF